MWEIINIESVAAALHDGGWRAEDVEEFTKAYQINEHDAKKICACLNLFHARLLEGLRESGNLRKDV